CSSLRSAKRAPDQNHRGPGEAPVEFLPADLSESSPRSPELPATRTYPARAQSGSHSQYRPFPRTPPADRCDQSPATTSPDQSATSPNSTQIWPSYPLSKVHSYVSNY